MSLYPTIAISPSGLVMDESNLINRLFDAGLYRYHINKTAATEQSIAEILEGIEIKYLSRITLHSHFHLVLAYGVGGIHYSLAHRSLLADDYPSKVGLYQAFGVKVSTDTKDNSWSPADYALSENPNSQFEKDDLIFIKTKHISKDQPKQIAILLEETLEFELLCDFLKESKK